MSPYCFVFELQGNLQAAIIVNSAHCFSFLIMTALLYCYNWRMDEAALICGASPLWSFIEVMLPLTWSGILSSLIVAFVLALKGLDISFNLLGGHAEHASGCLGCAPSRC